MTWDRLKSIDADALRPVFAAQAATKQSATIALRANQKLARRSEKRRCEDLRRVANVAKTLETLPTAGETWHVISNGHAAMWDFVPAILQLAAPATIRYLGIVTLSFSHQNLADLLELLDAAKVKRVDFLYSNYFRSNEREACDWLTAELTRRGQRVCAFRTHAKLLLFGLTDRRAISIESSANLRSCGKLEQMTITHDAKLLAFHRKWIEEIFAQHAEG